MKKHLSILLFGGLFLLNACQHYNKDDESYGFTVATRGIEVQNIGAATTVQRNIVLNGAVLGFGPVELDSVGFIVTRKFLNASTASLKETILFSRGRALGNYSFTISRLIDFTAESSFSVQAVGKRSDQTLVMGNTLNYTISTIK